ncbi:MAG: VOC family protein [Chloroflexota bacterium]|nr:VOC family protein [Chloroflexota bacterium]
MAPRFQVTIDCADPARLAEFWALALGYKLQDPPPGFATWPDFLTSIGVPEEGWNSRSAIVDPDGSGSRVFFQRVPEPKVTKNRVHLDVNVAEHSLQGDERRRRVDEHVARLVEAGATRVGELTEHGERWVVLQDPEGNEFCVQ